MCLRDLLFPHPYNCMKEIHYSLSNGAQTCQHLPKKSLIGKWLQLDPNLSVFMLFSLHSEKTLILLKMLPYAKKALQRQINEMRTCPHRAPDCSSATQKWGAPAPPHFGLHSHSITIAKKTTASGTQLAPEEGLWPSALADARICFTEMKLQKNRGILASWKHRCLSVGALSFFHFSPAPPPRVLTHHFWDLH